MPNAVGNVPRGQAMAEFALALPLLLLLVFGIIDFSRMILIHAAAVTASREGARFGAAVDDGSGTPQYLDCSAIRSHVREVGGSLLGLTPGQIRIFYDHGPGTSPVEACNPAPIDEDDVAPLDRITVEVTVPYQAITPMVHALVGPITVITEDRRTIAMAVPPP